MSNKQTDQFLTSFKALESAIRQELAPMSSVLDYENVLAEKKKNTESEKLKLCRIVRNYLAHNDTDFMVPSKDMIDFIDDLTVEILSSNGTAKDKMSTLAKYGSLSTSATLMDACTVLGKKKLSEIPVINDDGTLFGILTAPELCNAIIAAPQPKKFVLSRLTLSTANWSNIPIDTPVKSIPTGKLLVVDKKGKIKGVIC